MPNTPQNKSIEGRRSDGGFTFVELLVTIVLIAAILPVAMRGIGLCTRLAGQSRKKIEAASLAKTKLTELMAADEWDSGSGAGDFGTDWPGYRWSTEVYNWTDSVVSQVDLTVHWQAQGEEQSITLTTLAYAEEE